MVEIKMGNVVSKINGLTQDQVDIITYKLSYQKLSFFGSDKNRKLLFNPSTRMTYTGLIPYVLSVIGDDYKLMDLRIKPPQNANYKIVEPFKPRDYQKEIIDKVSSRECIQACTGAGKTFIIAALIEKFNVNPVIIVAPKVSLAIQLKDEIEKFLGVSIGLIGGGNNLIEDITIGTPQSLINYPDLINEAKAIFFDECHSIACKTIFEIANKAINSYYRIGLSATPWRAGGEEMLIEAALNIRKPHLSINASSLISKNKLVPCNINFIPVRSKTEWLGNYNDTYLKTIVNNQQRNEIIIGLSEKEYRLNNSTLILIKNIEHGELLLNLLKNKIPYNETILNINNKQYDIGNIEFLSGKDDPIRRKLVLQSVKDGFTKILIGSTIADEGLDVPCLKTLILAGSGKSSTKAFQRIGRVLRLYPNKLEANVYDFLDSCETFYKHALYRKELYETEKLWNINILN